MLAESAAACRRIDPQWDYRRIIIEGPLDVFCLTYGHRLPSRSTPSTRSLAPTPTSSDSTATRRRDPCRNPGGSSPPVTVMDRSSGFAVRAPPNGATTPDDAEHDCNLRVRDLQRDRVMAWFRPMGADEVAYHQSTVLGRADDHPGRALDYYGSRGETPLRWGGAGAASLGLAGEVTPEAYEAAFGTGGFRDPGTGERLVASRRPGFELVVSAHKSVAVLGVAGDLLESSARWDPAQPRRQRGRLRAIDRSSACRQHLKARFEWPDCPTPQGPQSILSSTLA